MDNSTTAQELYWPQLEQFIDQPLNKIPEPFRALAIASVLPFLAMSITPPPLPTARQS